MNLQANRLCRNSTTLAFVVTAVLGVSITSVASAADFCAGMVTDKQQRIVKRLDKPKVLQSYTDPAFGTRVTRVTNAPYGTARRTLYNTIQPWNSDESLLILYHTGGKNAGHHLYDGKTFRYIRALEFAAADIEGIYWDKNDSNILYYVQRRPNNDWLHGKLVKYNVKTRKRSMVADFDPICGKPSNRSGRTVVAGNDIQGIAGHKIGLRCQNDKVKNQSSDITFHVDVRTGKISPRVTIDPTKPFGGNKFGSRPDVAATPMHSSKRIVVQENVFDEQMNFLYRLDGSRGSFKAKNGKRYTVPKLEHASIGRMPNGNDALFSPQYNASDNGCDGDSDYGRGALVAHNVQSGDCNVIVGESTGWGYPLRGVHLSAVSLNNSGWVTMSTVGYGNLQYLTNGSKAPLLFSEISLTYADPGNPRTCRLAHTRTLGNSANLGGEYRGAYFGEPHPVMSPSGSRILFNSDWYDSGSVDTYAIQLNARSAGKKSTRNDIANNKSESSSNSAPAYSLSTKVRMNESPPRVYVNFVDSNQGSKDRVTIARAGSPDGDLLMRLYTNGTPATKLPGPSKGQVDFLQAYIGRGKFEARLSINGDFSKIVKRTYFTIP